MIIIGGNPAEAHPVAMQHVLASQGDQPRQHDRRRSALHAHGRARDRVCALPLRHRHSGRLGHALAHLPERLGGQGIHRQARLRHGRRPQGGRQVDARRGRARHRRAGRAAASASREKFAKEKPATLDLVHGRDAAHGRHRERARLLHRCCLATGNVGAPGTGANIFRGHTNVQGATDLGLDITTLPLYYGLTEGAWKHWARVWEVEYEWLQSQLRRGAGEGRAQGPHPQGEHGDARHHLDAVVRRREPARGAGRPARRHQGDDRRSAMAATPSPASPKPTKGMRSSTCWSSPIRIRRPSRRCATGKRQHLPPADRDLARMRRLAHGLEPLAAMGREDRRSRSSSRRTTTRSMYLLAKKLGFADRMFKNIKVENNEPVGRGHPARDQSRRLVDGLLRPVAGAPQGAYEEPGQVRSGDAARAEGRLRRSAATITACPGRAGASRRSAIPARTILYNTNLHVKDGGRTFRARFGARAQRPDAARRGLLLRRARS